MSMYLENNVIVQIFHGEPIRLQWGAWQTNSHALYREGWKFSSSTQSDEYSRAFLVRIAATSPDNRTIMAGTFCLPLEEIFAPAHLYNLMQSEFSHYYGRIVQMGIYDSKHVFETISVPELNTWTRMTAVDVMQAQSISRRTFSMKDFNFFKQFEDQSSSDIYIPEKSVDDLFNEILKIQYPQQQEIKKGLIMPEKKPIIQAKIFSLVA